MSWVYIILAGLLEVLVVAAIRKIACKEYVTGFAIYIISLTSSLYFLHLAMRVIDMSIAYTAYTGIGVAGTVLAGMFVWGESKNKRKLIYLVLILLSVAMLKMSG